MNMKHNNVMSNVNAKIRMKNIKKKLFKAICVGMHDPIEIRTVIFKLNDF